MSRINKIIKLHLTYLSRILDIPFVKPQTVTFTLTSKCNLRCIMCDHWKLKNQEELSLNRIKILINQIKKWGVKEVELSGGEPFMREDIWDIISYVSSKGIGMNITTNGTLLSDEDIKRLFDYKINRLQISLDGLGNIHDNIRGVKGSFKRIIKTVRAIDNIRKQKNSSMEINATTVIMQQNLTNFVKFAHMMRKECFDSITFQPVNDSNLEIGKKKRFNPLWVKDLKLLDEKIDELIKLRKDDTFIGNPVSYLKSIKDYFRNKKFKKVDCYSGFLGAIITPQGRLWSCKGDFGYLKKENIQKIWKSEEANKVRKRIKKCKNPCLYPCYLSSKGESLIKTTLNILKNG